MLDTRMSGSDARPSALRCLPALSERLRVRRADVPQLCTAVVVMTMSTTTLWAVLDDDAVPVEDKVRIAWHVGYAEAYRDGFDAGYQGAEQDMELRWHRVFLDVQAMAARPTFAELQRRREVA